MMGETKKWRADMSAAVIRWSDLDNIWNRARYLKGNSAGGCAILLSLAACDLSAWMRGSNQIAQWLLSCCGCGWWRSKARC